HCPVLLLLLPSFPPRRSSDLASGDPVTYTPNLAMTYWSFRLMIGMAAGSVLLALMALWLTRKGRVTDNVWFARVGLVAIPMPFLDRKSTRLNSSHVKISYAVF